MRGRTAKGINAGYDAAQPGGRNEEHWRLADGLSAAAANAYPIRKTLREKARYEYSNNGYAKGLSWTLATDLVGTRVRVQFRSGKRSLNQFLEYHLTKWFRQIRLAKKLRTGRVMRSVDGEAFFIRQFSPRRRGPIKTTVRLVECDHFDDPYAMDEENYVGGVTLDPRDQEPVSYTMMKQHPGDSFAWNPDTETIDADDVFHWMREDRGGQVRAVSEMCQSLSLYGQSRRLSLATLDAAEAAAAIAAVFHTQSMPLGDDGLPDYDGDVEAFDTLAIEHGMYMSLPRGYDAKQMKAEHPTTTFGDFQEAIVNEAGRGQQAPSHKSRGNSSGYNYASVRKDDQDYYKLMAADRTDLGDEGLEKIASWYLQEAVHIYPELRDIDPFDLPDHVWYFDGNPHVDETKHATATAIMVNAELKAEDDVLLEEGIDPETHWEKIREQRKRRAELNEIGPAPGQSQPQHNNEESSSSGDDEEDPDDTERNRAKDD